MTLRVGVDVSSIRYGLSNGIAVYTARLTRALLALPEGPDVVAYFCARATPEAEAVLGDLTAAGAEVVRGPAPWRWSPDGAWWLPLPPPMGPLLERVDVFHAGDFQLPRHVRTPLVATVHDLTTFTMPEHHTLLNRRVHARRLRWVTRRADRVIAISRSTADDLERIGHFPPDRIRVVSSARGQEQVAAPAEVAGTLRRYGLDGRRYILSVGTLEPRKNQERLVRAFQALAEDLGDVLLVLTGGKGWGTAAVRHAVAASRVRDRICITGAVPAADLAALYAGATVFAYPSLYEGFGLPILEAMAAGTPVITSNVSSLPEVAGGAALLVDPHSVDALRETLERLLRSPGLRAELSRLGREREAEFTWRRTAERTLSVYHQACERY